MDYSITHKDIVRIGYLFVEPEQEKVFLDEINEKLSHRVGSKILSELAHSKNIANQNTSTDLITKHYIKGSPEHLAIVKKIREGLLDELSVQRKNLMIARTNIGISQENKAGCILYSETNVS